jgi:outer membrane immunogenic protein
MSRLVYLASAALGAVMLPLGAAQAQAPAPFDWTGFYAGVHGGFLQGHVEISDEGIIANGNLEGGIGGVLAGYNLRFAPLTPFIVGIEADVGFGNISGTGADGGYCPPREEITLYVAEQDCVRSVYSYDFDWNAHLRVRTGIPVGNGFLFLAAGIAWAHLNVTSQYATELGGLYTGGTFGGGLDVRITPKVVGRIEALVDKFERKDYGDYSVDFSSWTARAALMVKLP